MAPSLIMRTSANILHSVNYQENRKDNLEKEKKKKKKIEKIRRCKSKKQLNKQDFTHIA